MTFKPTFEFYLLTNRIQEGDITAIPEIWPLMFDEPLDITREPDDITKEFGSKIAELFPPKEAPTTAERVAVLQNQVFDLLEELAPGVAETIRKVQARQ